jgi:hypothetical protein
MRAVSVLYSRDMLSGRGITQPWRNTSLLTCLARLCLTCADADDDNEMATENAIAALGKLIEFHRQAIPPFTRLCFKPGMLQVSGP